MKKKKLYSLVTLLSACVFGINGIDLTPYENRGIDFRGNTIFHVAAEECDNSDAETFTAMLKMMTQLIESSALNPVSLIDFAYVRNNTQKTAKDLIDAKILALQLQDKKCSKCDAVALYMNALEGLKHARCK